MARHNETATVHTRNGQPLREPPFVVRVMARAEGYAMVRRPRAMPFVLKESDLQPVTLQAVKGGASHG